MRKKLFISFILVFVCICTKAQMRQTQEEYIERYKAIAVAHMERYGIPASITMAQGLLESDSGNSDLSRRSNNHFGIKCHKNWTGEKVFHDDDAKGECFRSYPSVEASYQDHAEFLDASPRYDSLFNYSQTDYRSWARGLKAAGYATAPDYATRLVRIIEKYKLYLLDRGVNYDYTPYQSVQEDTELKLNTEIKAVGGYTINPDAFRVSIYSHDGYSVYRTNRVAYIIAKSGDTWASIGKRFDISEKTLRKFNDARNMALLGGDVVYIERKKTRWLGNTLHHIILKGENIHTIAQSYGIREQSLRKLNRLNKEFREGQIINLR